MPTSMVDVRIFIVSSSAKGSVTLKNSPPDWTQSSSSLSRLTISTSLSSSILASFVSSRSIHP